MDPLCAGYQAMSGEPSPLDPGCACSGARGVPENMRNSGRGKRISTPSRIPCSTRADPAATELALRRAGNDRAMLLGAIDILAPD